MAGGSVEGIQVIFWKLARRGECGRGFINFYGRLTEGRVGLDGGQGVRVWKAG